MPRDPPDHRILHRFDRPFDNARACTTEPANGQSPLRIGDEHSRQFVGKITRQQIGGDLRHFTRFRQPDDLLHHFMDQSQIARPSFRFIAETGVICQACEMTGDDRDQAFIIGIESICTRTLHAQRANGLSAISKRDIYARGGICIKRQGNC